MKLRSLFCGLLATGALLSPQLYSQAEPTDAPAVVTAPNAATVTNSVTVTNVVNIAEVDRLMARVESLQRDNENATENWTAAAAQNAALSNVLTGLQQSLDNQRKREIELTEEARAFNARVMLGAGGAIFLVFLASYWFQLRCLNRIMEVTHGHAHELPAPYAPALLEAAQARESKLLDAVKLLEDRIRHLETPASLTNGNGASHENGHAPAYNDVIEATVASPTSPEAPIATKVSVLLAKGEVLLETERFQDAVNAFNEALAYEPNNAEVHLKKGIALERSNKLELALSCYNDALRINPKRSFAYVHKARVLAALHRYDEALSVYDLALGKPEKPANGETVRMFKDAEV
ncbi:MAG TPA: tetratricopeptide repeat protein [Verrucomicrobiae bacterium]|nr:tetratricopeptide repeat protein [Verrucomicrobiae bacterium]